ncbi:MAG: MMPL family transporter [Jiangellaceae bacterium]
MAIAGGRRRTIFDPRSVDAADEILSTVEEGIGNVSEELPLSWSRRVVVYALSDIRVLAGLDDLPGGDPERLDGVAFPVRASPGSRELAGHRFMLHPRMIDRDGAARDRLIRHELTHVAIARRDDHVPTWLSEGIAEYISVQAIAPQERMISREAAESGIRRLPRDGQFNGSRVITAAAAIMVCVFASFLLSDAIDLAVFGFGLAVAVLIDASLVRMVLVPSVMQLLGERNWWIPRWLARCLPRPSPHNGSPEAHRAPDAPLVTATTGKDAPQ